MGHFGCKWGPAKTKRGANIFVSYPFVNYFVERLAQGLLDLSSKLLSRAVVSVERVRKETNTFHIYRSAVRYRQEKSRQEFSVMVSPISQIRTYISLKSRLSRGANALGESVTAVLNACDC